MWSEQNQRNEDAIRGWAAHEAKDSYAGVWTDFDEYADAFPTVAFSRDVEAYRVKVHERFGDHVRVIEADYAHTELVHVRDSLASDLVAYQIVSVDIALYRNRVGVQLVGGYDERLASLTHRYGTRICLYPVLHASSMDPGGPVRPLLKADGWRDDPSDRPIAPLQIAYDRETAERAWADNVSADLPRRDGKPPPEGIYPAGPGIYGDLDDVDFAQQAAVVWSAGQSGTCPAWLADIHTSPDGHVTIQTSTAREDVCTDDFRPYRMVLAVDRDRLPAEGDLPATSDVDGTPDAQVEAYPSSANRR